MQVRVARQFVGASERAAAVAARVGLFTGVRPPVAVEVVRSCKATIADGADMRFLPAAKRKKENVRSWS